MTTPSIDWLELQPLKPVFHEAGHAVIARVNGFQVAWVSTDPAFIKTNPLAIENKCNFGDALCMTLSSPCIQPIIDKRGSLTKEDKAAVMGYCMHVLAGPETEHLLDPDGFDLRYAERDYAQVLNVLKLTVRDKKKATLLLKNAQRQMRKQIKKHWYHIADVACRLQDNTTLFGNDIDAIIRKPSARPL